MSVITYNVLLRIGDWDESEKGDKMDIEQSHWKKPMQVDKQLLKEIRRYLAFDYDFLSIFCAGSMFGVTLYYTLLPIFSFIQLIINGQHIIYEDNIESGIFLAISALFIASFMAWFISSIRKLVTHIKTYHQCKEGRFFLCNAVVEDIRYIGSGQNMLYFLTYHSAGKRAMGCFTNKYISKRLKVGEKYTLLKINITDDSEILGVLQKFYPEYGSTAIEAEQVVDILQQLHYVKKAENGGDLFDKKENNTILRILAGVVVFTMISIVVFIGGNIIKEKQQSQMKKEWMETVLPFEKIEKGSTRNEVHISFADYEMTENREEVSETYQNIAISNMNGEITIYYDRKNQVEYAKWSCDEADYEVRSELEGIFTTKYGPPKKDGTIYQWDNQKGASYTLDSFSSASTFLSVVNGEETEYLYSIYLYIHFE